MKNTGIHEGPVRKGGISNNNSSTKPDILPAGQGTKIYKQNEVDIDVAKIFSGISNNNSSNKPRIVPTGQSDILLRNVLAQINNANAALDAEDRGSALAALKKAKKFLTDFYDEGGNFW